MLQFKSEKLCCMGLGVCGGIMQKSQCSATKALSYFNKVKLSKCKRKSPLGWTRGVKAGTG